MRQDMAWADTFDLGTLASQLNQSCVTMRDGCGTKFGQVSTTERENDDVLHCSSSLCFWGWLLVDILSVSFAALNLRS